MNDELHDKRRAFHTAIKDLDYGRAVTIGSYVGALIAKVQILEKEKKSLEEKIEWLYETYCDI